MTKGKGADVIYDPVGGEFSEQAFRAVAWNGRFLVIGFASGPIPKIPLNLALLKGASLVGVFWGAWRERDINGHNNNMNKILELWKMLRVDLVVPTKINTSELSGTLVALVFILANQ